ncbi:hypothetical protein KCV07_g3188, partial [Aureobasidium melanogenum]
MAPTTRSAARKATGAAGASPSAPPSAPPTAPTTSRAPAHPFATTRPFATTTGPVKTVDDDPDMVMDLDGLMNVVKDEEDFKYLKQALEDVPAANIGDVHEWVEQYKRDKYENELKAHVAAVAAAPEELKNSLLARDKSGIYDSIRPVKESMPPLRRTDETPAAADETDPSTMEVN